MEGRSIVLSMMLVSLMLLAGTVSLHSAGGTAGEPARSSRATPLDGEFRDDFDNDGNLTLTGDAGVVDGALTVDRRVLIDEFDRFILAPWVATEGNPRIYSGVLLTNATEMANATARVAMDLHDFQLTFDLSPGQLMTRGPTIMFGGASVDPLIFAYDRASGDIVIATLVGPDLMVHSSAKVTMETGEWYSARIEVSGRDLMFLMAGSMTSFSMDILGSFNSLHLQAPMGDNVAWDNVTLSKMGGSGSAVTNPLHVPVDTLWAGLSISYTASPVVTLEMSILDASTGQEIPGLKDIDSQYTNVRDILDPLVHESIQLKVVMEASGVSTPSINSWKITWVGDPPKFVKPLPKIEVSEDEPGDDVLDLRPYFEDYLTDDDNLTYTVSYVSDESNVRPVVDGYMLDIELPNENWHGTEKIRILCSDGTLDVESLETSVVVRPVDDPPVVDQIPRQVVDEDTEVDFNITPFLEDVDTPVEMLHVRVQSDYAKVDGHVITLFSDRGGISDVVLLEVYDFNSRVTGSFEVVFNEVDDAPVITKLDPVMVDEDMDKELDLSRHISDEDDELEDLKITIVEADRYITVEGMLITLHYDDTGGQFNYTIRVSDSNSTVSTVLRVTVNALNDPPVITSVGDHSPVGDRMDLNITEGNSTGLVIAVFDEEGAEIEYTLITEFAGATMDGDTLNLVTQVGQIGTYLVQVAVSDGAAADLVIIDMEITNRNDPPGDVSITAPLDNSTFENGTEVTFTGYSLDPDVTYGDEVEYHWTSDLDGDLGSGKTIKVSDLSVGVHTITMTATDGEESVDVTIRVTITGEDGSGGPGTDGDGGDDGGGEGGGISTGLLAGLVLVVVIVLGILIFVMRGRGTGPGEEEAAPVRDEAEEEGAIPDVLAPDEPLPPLEAGSEEPADEAASLYADDYAEAEAVKAGAGPEAAVHAEPAQERPRTFEAVSIDTASLAGTDPEQKRLDDLKRKYQAAISALPFGVPAKELQGMDWYEVAAALATGEQRELEDGRTVTRIGEHWFYSDVEDPGTFLRLHE